MGERSSSTSRPASRPHPCFDARVKRGLVFDARVKRGLVFDARVKRGLVFDARVERGRACRSARAVPRGG